MVLNRTGANVLHSPEVSEHAIKFAPRALTRGACCCCYCWCLRIMSARLYNTNIYSSRRPCTYSSSVMQCGC